MNVDAMEDALRVLEAILEDAQDWNAGELIEQLEGAIESLNEAIATAAAAEEGWDA
jgi:translation initiation factor 2B subunit (eIF-2B alpha/beta/delta family)